MIYAYTSIFNGFDNLRSPCCSVAHNVKFICFTNLPVDVLPAVYPWEYCRLESRESVSRGSRRAKILAHHVLPSDAEYSIYHDGNFQLREDPNDIIDRVLGPEQWAAHKHPCRSCIYKEAEILLKERIGTPELVEKDIAAYRASGYPEDAGLWANGMIVRRHTPEVAALNERWWDLYSSGCERDQISFPVARAQQRVPVRTINANVYASPYIKFNWHAAWKDRDDNPYYRPQRDEIRRTLAARGIGYPEY